MSSVNPLLELWRSGKPSLGGWLTTADPQIVEYLATCGFDEICIDQQHGLADGASLAEPVPLDRAARRRADHPRSGQRFRDDRQGARRRGGGHRRAHGQLGRGGRARCGRLPLPTARRALGRSPPGSLLRASKRLEGLDEAACVVMVETAEGLAQRRRDRRHAGSRRDLHRSGRPRARARAVGLVRDWKADEARTHADAIAAVLAACRRHGVAPGIHTGDGGTAHQYLEQGFLYVTVANELG